MKELLAEINNRFIEKYYQRLLKTPAVVNPIIGKRKVEYVSTSTIRDIYKLLRSCFQQAIKWELMEKNPCIYATVPKHKTSVDGFAIFVITIHESYEYINPEPNIIL